MNDTRHAVVLTEFGDSSNLKLTDLPMPRLHHPDELLIRVAATSVNPIEWKMRQGLGIPKWLWRRAIGSPMVLGLDFSGEVAAVGEESGPFQPGDAVMGALPFAGSYTTHLALRTPLLLMRAAIMRFRALLREPIRSMHWRRIWVSRSPFTWT